MSISDFGAFEGFSPRAEGILAKDFDAQSLFFMGLRCCCEAAKLNALQTRSDALISHRKDSLIHSLSRLDFAKHMLNRDGYCAISVGLDLLHCLRLTM